MTKEGPRFATDISCHLKISLIEEEGRPYDITVVSIWNTVCKSAVTNMAAVGLSPKYVQ
jgi:hypothetical protein